MGGYMDAATLIRDARGAAGLSQRELAKIAGTSQPAIVRYERGTSVPTLTTLDRLLEACGRRVVLSAEPVIGLATKDTPLAQRLRRHRDELIAASRSHGAHDVRVFGSVARREDRPDSDIDLLVDLEPGRTLLDLVAFGREASEILDIPVDVATPDMLPDRARRARSESVTL
jgi:predicted nucleotidyltransferase/DNA-binding XRE family transcriptional regulator